MRVSPNLLFRYIFSFIIPSLLSLRLLLAIIFNSQDELLHLGEVFFRIALHELSQKIAMSIHVGTDLSRQGLFFFRFDLFSKSSEIGKSIGPSIFKFPLQFSYLFFVRLRSIFYLGDMVLGS